MPEIPERIKMQGKFVRVVACSRRCEVQIGETIVCMPEDLRRRMRNTSTEQMKRSIKELNEEMDTEMYKLYEQALNLERERIRK